MRGVLLMIFALLMVSSCSEKESKRRTLGYRGEAKSNPFLAAQRFLESQGKQVVLEHGLSHFDESTAVIFLPPSSMNTVGRSKRLLEWVADGGHLVVMLDGGEMGGGDFTKNPGKQSIFNLKEDRPGVNYLLDELDITLDDREHVSTDTEVDVDDLETDAWEDMAESDRVLLDSEEAEMMFESEPIKVHHWSDQVLIYPEMYEEEYGSGEVNESEKHRFLSVTYAEGRVTWLTDARPFRNRYIAYADHALFLKELTRLSGPGKIVFSSGAGEGLFTLLWRHFSLFLLASLVAVTLWLWRHLPRFGPEQDIGEGQMREHTSQVRGIGRFLWRNKRDDVMLDAMRASVNRRLSLAPGPASEAAFEQIAKQSNLPVVDVTEAMIRKQIHEPGAMVRVIKNLQQILNTLTKN